MTLLDLTKRQKNLATCISARGSSSSSSSDSRAGGTSNWPPFSSLHLEQIRWHLSVLKTSPQRRQDSIFFRRLSLAISNSSALIQPTAQLLTHNGTYI